MNTRLLVAAGATALVLATAATAATSAGPGREPEGVLVAACADGSEWVAVVAPATTADEPFAGSPLATLDAVLSSLPPGCDGLVLPPPVGVLVPEPGLMTIMDAAVWSRGAVPVFRASDVP